MDELDYIIGLMKTETDALGFIPSTKVDNYYIANGQYVIQTNAGGKQIGYILHGKPKPGQILTIAQAVIDYDYRNRGFGMLAVYEVINRAQVANCRAVICRCGADIDAVLFWELMGFNHTKTSYPNNRRNRAINTYVYDLWPRLIG